MSIDKEFEEKSGKGYGQNKIILQVRDPETIHAYWEIGAEQQKRVKEDREGELVLRLKCMDGKSKYIRLDRANFLGSYYLKENDGVKPDKQYFAEIGIIHGASYVNLTPKSNIVTTPRESISNDTSEEWLDPTKKRGKLESKLDKKSTLKLLEKTDKQIKEDRKSSEFFHNYFIK